MHNIPKLSEISVMDRALFNDENYAQIINEGIKEINKGTQGAIMKGISKLVQVIEV